MSSNSSDDERIDLDKHIVEDEDDQHFTETPAKLKNSHYNLM